MRRGYAGHSQSAGLAATGTAVIVTMSPGVSAITGYIRGRRRRRAPGTSRLPLWPSRHVRRRPRAARAHAAIVEGQARDSRRDSRSTWAALRRVGGDRWGPHACAAGASRETPSAAERGRGGASALTQLPRTLTRFPRRLPMERVSDRSDATCPPAPDTLHIRALITLFRSHAQITLYIYCSIVQYCML